MAEIDTTLREEHLSKLRSEESRRLYDRTLAACRERPGGLAPPDQDMTYDLCTAEDLKQDLLLDVRQRGAMVESRNGRQTYRKENPALARIARLSEYQRKIRTDLGLTKRPRDSADNGEPADDKDDFDNF